ncbi:unnamed protein product [Ectocarpus sp. 12 AP-2014]
MLRTTCRALVVPRQQWQASHRDVEGAGASSCAATAAAAGGRRTGARQRRVGEAWDGLRRGCPGRVGFDDTCRLDVKPMLLSSLIAPRPGEEWGAPGKGRDTRGLGRCTSAQPCTLSSPSCTTSIPQLHEHGSTTSASRERVAWGRRGGVAGVEVFQGPRGAEAVARLHAHRPREHRHQRLEISCSGAHIAFRFGAVRTQGYEEREGASPGSERQVLNYPTQQWVLLPLLAHAYALHFAGQHMESAYHYYLDTPNSAALPDLHATCAEASAALPRRRRQGQALE